jgi:hypothetical protein
VIFHFFSVKRMKINVFSFGMGDRFAQQGIPQLKAVWKALDQNVHITPVWNKSYREHKTVGSNQGSVREEADQATSKLQWQHAYLVDADHINLQNVDGFIDASDFFTIDVAEFIGQKSHESQISEFVQFNYPYIGTLEIPGIPSPFKVSEEFVWHIGEKFLLAAEEASRVYMHINSRKGTGNFVPEISMDEVEDPQTPYEMFFILSALHFYGVKPQTIAPKFTGRFNKGVDYTGDLNLFQKEFEEDLMVIDYAIKEFGLPEDLKLSVHSGSDKFSIYPVISRLIRKHKKGLHIKTAGTTWLEELAGLALSGMEGLEFSKLIYRKAFDRYDELTSPYATVIGIHKSRLPSTSEVSYWNSDKFFESLHHNPLNSAFNQDFRQLLHVSYKIAAEMSQQYLGLVRDNEKFIAPLVTENLYEKHIKPLFID